MQNPLMLFLGGVERLKPIIAGVPEFSELFARARARLSPDFHGKPKVWRTDFAMVKRGEKTAQIGGSH